MNESGHKPGAATDEPGVTESRLQQAASIAKLGHYVWDAVTDRCLFCSEEHARIHGMSVDDYMARSSTLDGLAHPDDRKAVNAAFRALRKGENFELEYRIITPGGETRFIREIGRPIKDADGVVVQEIGTCQDITKGKQTELALRENEQRLKNAQRIARLGSWEIDTDGHRKNWSEETFRLLGIPDSERPNASTHHGVSVHPDDLDRIRRETEKALSDHSLLDTTYRLDCPDGACRTIHEIAEPATTVTNGLLTATVQDISERVRLEEKLSQAQRLEAVGNLTGGIAHDFNNLLGVIQGNAELLSRQSGIDQSLTQAILSASQRGAELTSRLLAFSRRQSLDPKLVDPGELIAELSFMIDRTLGEMITIETQLAEVLWPCLVDPGQLENALLNLAINARDAMSRGGTIFLHCENRRFAPDDDVYDLDGESVLGDFVVVSVRDEGKVMPPADRQRCIEPFYTTKGETHGSGLGLSMVYGFIMQTRGHLAIESAAGVGTTITLFLPRSSRVPARPDVEQPDHYAAPQGETVLILEDDPAVLKMVAEMVETMGYKTLLASDAGDARHILNAETPFDILLTDIVIGSDVSGPEFADEVLSRRPEMPVVFMSGYSEDLAENRGLLGEDRVLLKKPFPLKDLATALRRSLDAP
ncbi:MAG: PAS domain-containing protein [Pseudomonadota bacterium]